MGVMIYEAKLFWPPSGEREGGVGDGGRRPETHH